MGIGKKSALKNKKPVHPMRVDGLSAFHITSIEYLAAPPKHPVGERGLTLTMGSV